MHKNLRSYFEIWRSGKKYWVNLITKNKIKKSFLYIKKYGFLGFLKELKRIRTSIINVGLLQNDIPFSIVENPSSAFFNDVDYNLEIFSDSVSIIIPTKNAGDDFEYLLKMVKNQYGFKKIEIIIVDSGSTDKTLEIAKAFDIKIINILPEEFSHSSARNLGAENASGDYLLFTVQDALPPTNTWLYELMTFLHNNDVCAVSCAETPRENADLFYRVISWNHYNFIGVNENDRIFRLPNVINHLSLRQNGPLSNLACLISSDIFRKYKFRNDYAEDLDLGIRLIKDGKRISFLGSIRIIHSHNRSAYYFLKRGYVDNLFLSDLFNDYPIPKINLKELIPDILFTAYFLNEVINNKLSKIAFPFSFEVLENVLRETFASANNNFPSIINTENNRFIDNEYRTFLERISNLPDYSQPKGKYKGVLINDLLGFSNIMIEYMNNSYEMVYDDLFEEIMVCLNKQLAQRIGFYLAFCYKNSSNNEKQKFAQIYSTLKLGI